ncbi:hypothetical protein ACWEOI_02545 [Nocardia sp. NPDC004340]
MKHGRTPATTAAFLTTVTLSSLFITSGTTTAAPEDVTVTASLADRTASITLDNGSFAVENGTLVIREPGGRVVRTLALYYKVDDLRYPIRALVSDQSVELTPESDPGQAILDPTPGALPLPDTQQQQQDRFDTTVAQGAAIGALAGGIPGAAAGCALGAGPGAGVGAIAGGVLGFIAGIIAAALLAPVIVSGEMVLVPGFAEAGAALGVAGGAITGTVGGCTLGAAIIGGASALVGALVGAGVGAAVAQFTTNPPPPQ